MAQVSISRYMTLLSPKNSIVTPCLRRAKSTIQTALDLANVGQSLQVHGWIKAIRKQKSNTFIDIDNGLVLGGDKLQIVIATHQVPDFLRYHAFIKAQGILKQSQHRGQAVDLE